MRGHKSGSRHFPVFVVAARSWLEQTPRRAKQGALSFSEPSGPFEIHTWPDFTFSRNVSSLGKFTPQCAKRGGRGEQGRRVSATRTTVPRDGGRVQRPRSADFPILHGAGLAAVGG